MKNTLASAIIFGLMILAIGSAFGEEIQTELAPFRTDLYKLRRIEGGVAFDYPEQSVRKVRQEELNLGVYDLVLDKSTINETQAKLGKVKPYLFRIEYEPEQQILCYRYSDLPKSNILSLVFISEEGEPPKLRSIRARSASQQASLHKECLKNSRLLRTTLKNSGLALRMSRAEIKSTIGDPTAINEPSWLYDFTNQDIPLTNEEIIATSKGPTGSAKMTHRRNTVLLEIKFVNDKAADIIFERFNSTSLPSDVRPTDINTICPNISNKHAALDTLDHTNISWQGIFQFYKKIRCADGALASVLAAQVNNLLDKKWHTFITFTALIDKDPEFKTFVMGWLDGGNIESYNRIENRLNKDCPRRDMKLCEEIVRGILKAKYYQIYWDTYRKVYEEKKKLFVKPATQSAN